MATTRCYRAQIRADRRAAARERATATVANDNARMDALYSDEYAMARHRQSPRPLPTELVVYPDLDFSRAARG